MTITNFKKYIKDRTKIDSNGCWLWQLSLFVTGYGQCNVNGESYAHRLTYKTFIGNIPKGLLVMHSCDVPACCNPNHLKVGTDQDNVNDKMAKGRWRHKKVLNIIGVNCDEL